MPVTPIPRTLQLDLGKEYLEFMEMASRAHDLSPQDIMREALSMLRNADLPLAELLREFLAFAGDGTTDLKKAYLAAWDRWSGNHGQLLPLSDDLAAFVDEQVAQGVAKEATGVVMLALLYYARVMNFLPAQDGEE